MSSDSAPTRAEDERAIREVTARFAEAIMRREVDEFRSLWTADGVWSIGEPMSVRVTGTEDIVGLLEQLWTGNDAFVHFAFPGVIEVDGDLARMTCMCQEAAKGPNGRFYRTYGMWSDVLRRADGGWRFVERAYQYLWLDTSTFSGDLTPLAPAPGGAGRRA